MAGTVGNTGPFRVVQLMRHWLPRDDVNVFNIVPGVYSGGNLLVNISCNRLAAVERGFH